MRQERLLGRPTARLVTAAGRITARAIMGAGQHAVDVACTRQSIFEDQAGYLAVSPHRGRRAARSDPHEPECHALPCQVPGFRFEEYIFGETRRGHLASGDGISPLVLPTLGGRQLWGDEFVHAGYRIQRNVMSGHHRLLDPRDLRLSGGSFDECRETFDRLREAKGIQPVSDHLVVLLHGYLRSKEVMHPMGRYLRAQGYDAWALNYPSTRKTLEDHAAQVEAVLDRSEGARTVSLVTHSMGGMVARVLLAREGGWMRRMTLNRLVMIGTPNQGAELAEHLVSMAALDVLLGPALAQLHRDKARRLPHPVIPFGLVAGAKGDGRGWNPLLPGDDDMTVTVDSVHLPGSEDVWIVQGAVHTFIHQRPDVIRGVERYLRTGRFIDPG